MDKEVSMVFNSLPELEHMMVLIYIPGYVGRKDDRVEETTTLTQNFTSRNLESILQN